MNIVEFWSKIFNFLRWISVFQILTKLFPSILNYSFVEKWVLGNLVASILSIFVANKLNSPILSYILVAYGFLRVFEIFIYQVNVLLFDEYRTRNSSVKYTVKSYRRMVILLLHNFVEIIFWFAASYSLFISDFSLVGSKSVLAILYMSFVTMTTFGPPNYTIMNNPGMLVVLFQSIVGLFMSIITLARFIGLLPKPETMDNSEKD